MWTKRRAVVCCSSWYVCCLSWYYTEGRQSPICGERYHSQLEWQCTINITLRLVRSTIVAVEKAISIAYSECVFVALGIRMQCVFAVLSSVASPALQYFSTLPHNGTIFGEKVIWRKMWLWFSLHLLPETFIILRRNEWDMTKYIYILVVM